MENKVLVLAYGAFDGRPRNTSYDFAVSVFGKDGVVEVDVDEAGFESAMRAIESFSGNVLWLGESDGKGDRLIFETKGRNLFLGRPICGDGCFPELLFRRRNEFSGCPVVFSRDAGDHFCNRALYEMLRRFSDRVCAFVHVPRFGRVCGDDLRCVCDKLEEMQ
jgi:hypothetical protein